MELPERVTVLLLPPYSPDENLWHYLWSHYWSNRAYDYDHLVDAGPRRGGS